MFSVCSRITFLDLGPLVPVDENMNCAAHHDILDNGALPTSRKQFGKCPFLIQYDNCNDISQIVRKWFDDITYMLDFPEFRYIAPLNSSEAKWNVDYMPSRVAHMLWLAIVNMWKGFPKITYQKLVKVFRDVCRL